MGPRRLIALATALAAATLATACQPVLNVLALPTGPASAPVPVCQQLATAPSNSTVVIPAGDHAVGDCLINGAGRTSVTVQAQYTLNGPVSRLVGMFQCTDCNGWAFDGIHVLGDAPDPVDPAFTVRMVRGNSWRWTNCNVSNAQGPDGKPYGVRGLFATTGELRNFRIDHCTFHSNGTSRPTVSTNNYDHLLYLKDSTYRTGGIVGPGNVFHSNSWGAPVKLGFGLSQGAPVGINGVTFTGNRLYNNVSPDGICGVLVAGRSPNTTLTGNTIDCTASPTTHTRSALAIRSWVAGDKVTLTDNTVSGAHNAGATTGCGTPVAGAYDNTVTVSSHWPLADSWQVHPSGCSTNGIVTSRNTTTR